MNNSRKLSRESIKLFNLKLIRTNIYLIPTSYNSVNHFLPHVYYLYKSMNIF